MDPFLGEIRAVTFNFAPNGWAICEGQLLSIEQNTALFSLLGTQFGGDGERTFGLPNLTGAVALGRGNFDLNFVVGQVGGSSRVALNTTQMPPHGHDVLVSTATAPTRDVMNGYPAVSARQVYGPTNGAAFNTGAIEPAGNGNPHDNRQPYLAVNYVIALVGVFPSRD